MAGNKNKRRPSFSTVVSFMSDERQAQFQDEAEGGVFTFALDEIRPDPEQPRRLFPDNLVQALLAGEKLPATVIQEWVGYANDPSAPAALKHRVSELQRLAESIANHGLINPITIRPVSPDEETLPNVKYFIVTGERRYWAHVLLVVNGQQIQEGNHTSQPTQIKAQLINEGTSIRAHQMIENILREDINAVEKAEGLWALRYELSGQPYGAKGKLVTWKDVEEAIGMSKRHRIRLTSVLKLSNEALELIATHDLSERAVRPIVADLKEQPDLQLEALEMLVNLREGEDGEENGGSVADQLKAIVAQLQGQPPKQAKVTRSKPAPSSLPHQLQTRLDSTLRFLEQVRDEDLDEFDVEIRGSVINDLQQLRDRLNDLITSLL